MSRTEETRRQILLTAKYLFQEYGFDKTSLDEIAHASHKAKRSLYNHFCSKEEIYTAVLDEELTNIRVTLEGVFNDERFTPSQRIRNYLIKRMELVSEAKIIQQLLKTRLVHYEENRFILIHKQFERFDAWERAQFIALSADKAALEVVDEDFNNHFNAEAFADMLQMVLKSLDITFFVQGKYAQYKPTFSYTIDRIIQMSFSTVVPRQAAMLM